MGDLFWINICLAILIVQICMLVEFLKKKEKKYFLILLFIEIIPILVLTAFLYYYLNVAPRNGFMPGLEYLTEELICAISNLLSIIMLCITIISKLLTHTKSKRKIVLGIIVLLVFIILVYLSLFYIRV